MINNNNIDNNNKSGTNSAKSVVDLNNNGKKENDQNNKIINNNNNINGTISPNNNNNNQHHHDSNNHEIKKKRPIKKSKSLIFCNNRFTTGPDKLFFFITQAMILVPSLLFIIKLIPISLEISKKFELSNYIISTFFLVVMFYNLYRCAFTDPGIIERKPINNNNNNNRNNRNSSNKRGKTTTITILPRIESTKRAIKRFIFSGMDENEFGNDDGISSSNDTSQDSSKSSDDSGGADENAEFIVEMEQHQQKSINGESSYEIQQEQPKFKEVSIGDNCKLRLKFCLTCNIYREPRQFHCSTCNNCVDHLDHHCVWIGNCIGRRNYKQFFYFTFSSFLYTLYTFVMSIVFLDQIVKLNSNSNGGGSGSDENSGSSNDLNSRFEKSISNILLALRTTNGGISIFIIIFSFLICSLLGFLTFYHIKLICKNLSTMEDYKKIYSNQTNPYDNGTFNNLKYRFCLNNTRKK